MLGVPSINMNFPVYKRICSEYELGVCIDNLESKTIQEAILSIILDKQKKTDRIKIECERAKKNFNWNNESKLLIDLINKHI